jgi:cell division protein FtsW (lipid II flippase)
VITIFTTASKYICLLLIVLYTYCNFRYLSIPDQEDANALCGWQFRMILLIHFLCNVILYLKTGETLTVLFYLLQLAFFIAFVFLSRAVYRNINRLLLNNTCLFICYGLIMLERLSVNKAEKQFAIIVISAAVSMIIPYLIDKIWDMVGWRYIFAAIGIALLGMVFVIGATSYGAKMSISIGGFSFQASELVKITFVLCTAGMLSKAESFRDIVITSLIAGAHMLILVMCKDLGSALIFFLAYLVMLYVATGQKLYLFLGNVAACGAGVLSYFLFSHVRTRVFAWLDPWADIDNKGYQITQSLFAIGTGGFAGLGLYQGMPNKIPIVEKDFIISAISEEMGGLTAICLTLICLGCFMQMMIIATYMQSGFYKYVSVGLAIEYVVQVFLTIGGAVKFIPSTGVTLPFVSYGGSSLVSSFIVFAIIQALYIIQGNEDEAETEINEMAEDEAERELYGDADEPADEYLDEDYDANAVLDDIPEEYEDQEPDQGRGSRRRRRR